MDDLPTVYPPKRKPSRRRATRARTAPSVGWRTVRADESGYVRLDDLIRPNEQAIVYGLVYVLSPDDRDATLLLGSDDGVRVWINGELVHTNPVYRAAEPDLDLVPVRLKKGWNKVLIKVLQGAGGWGFYVRFADPGGRAALTPSSRNERRGQAFRTSAGRRGDDVPGAPDVALFGRPLAHDQPDRVFPAERRVGQEDRPRGVDRVRAACG